MTLREMREKIDAFLSLGKHWRTEMLEWSAITPDTKLAPREGKTGLRLRPYTDRHVYSVAMYEAAEGKPSYLGCVMSNRAPWPGETHTRGGDLADGEFNDETLRDRGLDEDALRHVTFGHANAVFGLGLEGFEVETTYKISAWERYGWNSFSRLGA